MSKQSGIITFSGKIGDIVMVKSGKNGNHARAAPKKSNKPRSAAFTAQMMLTATLNRIASAVHRAADFYAKIFRPADFYDSLHIKMRERNTAERFVLLDAFRNLEINEAYPFTRFRFQPKLEMIPGEIDLTLRLQVDGHPESNEDFNSYYLQVIVLFWNTENDDVAHHGKMTAWISPKDELPLGCDFSFPRPDNASDYLVMYRVHSATNRNATTFFPDQGMKVISVGSFSEASLQALADWHAARKEELAKEQEEFLRPKLEEERVAMRKL